MSKHHLSCGSPEILSCSEPASGVNPTQPEHRIIGGAGSSTKGPRAACTSVAAAVATAAFLGTAGATDSQYAAIEASVGQSNTSMLGISNPKFRLMTF